MAGNTEDMMDIDTEDDIYLSTESSFYGDEDTREELEDRAASFSPEEWIAANDRTFPAIVARKKAREAIEGPSEPKKPELFNAYAGQTKCAWQLNETVDAFLRRIPPLSSEEVVVGPWIYAGNPHTDWRPLEEDWAGLTEAGGMILNAWSAKKAQITEEMARGTAGARTAKINREMKPVVDGILSLAVNFKCTSGKWMLFPYPDDLTYTWSVIAKGTVFDELGIAAKVGTDNGQGNRVNRLICVYTRNFADEKDVRRVLNRLAELKVLPRKNRSIYYKPDVYTHLGISSGNEFGFKPQIYASADMLAAPKGKSDTIAVKKEVFDTTKPDP
ncbi:MAG: hypothetical protein M1829_006834 [Trizodia sp. TS-e1964]|nr:MAG: hypothetical protein M1829_006834 [Trizodia sp. TS-e1964]